MKEDFEELKPFKTQCQGKEFIKGVVFPPQIATIKLRKSGKELSEKKKIDLRVMSRKEIWVWLLTHRACWKQVN